MPGPGAAPGARPGADPGAHAGIDPSPEPTALPAPDPGLRPFFSPEGRLITVPAKRSKRLLVLDRLAQLFEPGERYPEPEVNRLLRTAHDDVAMLRRYLVDEGFLDRASGVYWRIGGSVDGL